MNEKILKQMEKKAKEIKRLQLVANTILTNASYHTKEMEMQIMKAEKNGHITENEKKLICDIWGKRNKLAHEIIELGGKLDDKTP